MRFTGLHHRVPSRLQAGSWLGLGLLAAAAGCAHRGGWTGESEAAHAARARAASVGRIAFEDEFEEARAIFQALPANASERPALRSKLLAYLLEPLVKLDAASLRRQAPEVGGDDIAERVFTSFRDAADLFAPDDLAPGMPGLGRPEQDAIDRAARLILALFEPRGADSEVAFALAVLGTLEPQSPELKKRLDDLLHWSDESAQTAVDMGGKPHPSSIEVLGDTLNHWPALPVAEALSTRLTARQTEFRRTLSQPVAPGETGRRAIGDVLLTHGDELQRFAHAVASVWLRAGRIDRAADAVTKAAGEPGDDPDLRALCTAAARATDADDLVKLARRFLPRDEPFHGTAAEDPEPLVATRVLEVGVARFPRDAESLALTGRVARARGQPLLALRMTEEARTLLDARGSSPELLEASREVLELQFQKWTLHLQPERFDPAAAAAGADALRRRINDTRKRLAGQDLALNDRSIDVRLAKSYVEGGMPDQAEPLLLHAQAAPEPDPEVAIELANIALKRGDTARAAHILDRAIEDLPKPRGESEPIQVFETRARLSRLLGDAYEIAGEPTRAAAARRAAASAWERLLLFAFKQKIRPLASEGLFEVGRLTYLLDRRAEGLQRMSEALEHGPEREQTYVDTLVFLVEHGEVEQAGAAYRRLLARPDGREFEYIKVYASLWIQRFDPAQRQGS